MKRSTSIALKAACAWVGSSMGRGFVLGLVTGGVAVALLAPQSGSELRRTLKGKAQSGRDAVNEGLSKTAEKARSLADDAGTLVDRGKERVQYEGSRIASAVDAARSNYAGTATAS